MPKPRTRSDQTASHPTNSIKSLQKKITNALSQHNAISSPLPSPTLPAAGQLRIRKTSPNLRGRTLNPSQPLPPVSRDSFLEEINKRPEPLRLHGRRNRVRSNYYVDSDDDLEHISWPNQHPKSSFSTAASSNSTSSSSLSTPSPSSPTLPFVFPSPFLAVSNASSASNPQNPSLPSSSSTSQSSLINSPTFQKPTFQSPNTLTQRVAQTSITPSLTTNPNSSPTASASIPSSPHGKNKLLSESKPLVYPALLPEVSDIPHVRSQTLPNTVCDLYKPLPTPSVKYLGLDPTGADARRRNAPATKAIPAASTSIRQQTHSPLPTNSDSASTRLCDPDVYSCSVQHSALTWHSNLDSRSPSPSPTTHDQPALPVKPIISEPPKSSAALRHSDPAFQSDSQTFQDSIRLTLDALEGRGEFVKHRSSSAPSMLARSAMSRFSDSAASHGETSDEDQNQDHRARGHDQIKQLRKHARIVGAPGRSFLDDFGHACRGSTNEPNSSLSDWTCHTSLYSGSPGLMAIHHSSDGLQDSFDRTENVRFSQMVRSVMSRQSGLTHVLQQPSPPAWQTSLSRHPYAHHQEEEQPEAHDLTATLKSKIRHLEEALKLEKEEVQHLRDLMNTHTKA